MTGDDRKAETDLKTSTRRNGCYGMDQIAEEQVPKDGPGHDVARGVGSVAIRQGLWPDLP